MNEELQRQVVEALKALREGAPDAWRALCGEVVTRGIVIGLLSVAIAVMVPFVYRRVDSWAAAKCDDIDMSAIRPIGIMCASAASIVCLSIGVTYFAQAIAPGLTLLGR